MPQKIGIYKKYALDNWKKIAPRPRILALPWYTFASIGLRWRRRARAHEAIPMEWRSRQVFFRYQVSNKRDIAGNFTVERARVVSALQVELAVLTQYLDLLMVAL